jgi:uncharacterized protein involved in exopolysaccharide biosynthesis
MDTEREIDVVSVFWIVWDQKYLVLAISLLFGVIATVYALTARPMFRAQVVVTEVHDTGMGPGGGLMGQLGGLASIAGLNLNASGADAERAAVLESRGLTEAFIRRYNLAPVLNGKSKNGDSVWYAVENFRSLVFALHEDKIKGTTTITIEWRDPVVAARWANDLVHLANEMLRARAIEDSTRNIEYLNKQSAQTNVVEIQHATYSLIEAETKNLMLAHGRADYAFTIVDPAVPPEFRFSPRRSLIVISGLFVGGFLGSLIAWGRKSLRRRPSTATT